MKKIKSVIVAIAIVLFGMTFSAPSVHACDPQTDVHCVPICDELDDEQKMAAGCTVDPDTNVTKNITNIINVAISIVGILAVLVIVIAGQRFITAAGDPNKVKQAKDMVIYAAVGLVVAGLAYAIIMFVATALGNVPTS